MWGYCSISGPNHHSEKLAHFLDFCLYQKIHWKWNILPGPKNESTSGLNVNWRTWTFNYKASWALTLNIIHHLQSVKYFINLVNDKVFNSPKWYSHILLSHRRLSFLGGKETKPTEWSGNGSAVVVVIEHSVWARTSLNASMLTTCFLTAWRFDISMQQIVLTLCFFTSLVLSALFNYTIIIWNEESFSCFFQWRTVSHCTSICMLRQKK